MEKKYLVVFRGIQGDEERFRDHMARLGVPGETLGELIRRAPVVIKRDVTLREARRYADAVQDCGGRVTIQENGYTRDTRRMNAAVTVASFEEFTMCPECGLKQARSGVCAKCGSPLAPHMQ